MGVELIHDKDPLALWIDREGLFNRLFKVHFGTGRTYCWTKELSGGYFQVGDQALGAVPFIFKLLVFDPPRVHWQRELGALEGLDAGFFIGTD